MDWVIIGGGTAGGYLASRLLDYGHNVLILEAGGDRLYDPKCDLAKNIGKVMYNDEYTKTFNIGDKNVRMGSGLGGGSAVNGGYLVYESNEHLIEMGINPKTQDILK